MMRKIFIVRLIIVPLMFCSCIKQSPQLPSNKGEEIDSSAVTMLAINKRLAAKEDKLLQEYTSKNEREFIKSELGFWYRINKKTTESFLSTKHRIHFEYELKNLEGVILEKGKKTTTIGKKEVVSGLEEGLKLMRRGESATVIIPWNLGYGMNGYESIVPAYTTLVYEIKLIN